MMRPNRFSCLFVWVLAAFCWGILPAAAQNQSLDALREEMRRAKEDIEATDQLLSKIRKDQKSTQSELKLIQNRIRNRKNIVSNLEKQTQVISRDIGSKNDTISRLRGDLTQLRTQYGEMVYSAYKNYKLNNFMLFLFASKDFNDATRRIAYMRRYNRMREQKAAEIDSVASTLNVQVGQLQGKKEDLDKVRQTRTEEIGTLGKDEQQYKSSSAKLTAQAGKLSSDIKKKKSQVDRLQQQIQRIIAEEARKNRTETRTEAQEQYITELSGRFDQNRGKLPYPVRGGVIVDRYGVHEHATQKGLMVNNKGVNIAAERAADVRAVFEGEIKGIFFFQGLNNSVIIRHGNYLTVYSNLESVAVKNGDKVSLNQVIGRLSDSGDEDDRVLHFEIWQETTNLNPESWLRR